MCTRGKPWSVRGGPGTRRRPKGSQAVLREEGDERKRREPSNVGGEPVPACQLEGDEDGRAEGRDLSRRLPSRNQGVRSYISPGPPSGRNGRNARSVTTAKARANSTEDRRRRSPVPVASSGVSAAGANFAAAPSAVKTPLPTGECRASSAQTRRKATKPSLKLRINTYSE